MAAASSLAVLKAVAASRSSGTCNLAGRSLTEVPSALYNPDEPLPASVAAESKWWEVSELGKIDLSRNALTRLPEELGLLTSITHLDLSSNSLQQLFFGLTNLRSLKLLSVDSNKLRTLPDSIPLLPSLVVLSAASNSLALLPEQLGYRQPMLASVSCQSNSLEQLPPGLGYCSSLTKLDASSNRLASLSPQLLQAGGMSASLAELNLSSNALRSLPGELGMLSKLRVLNLKENQLGTLPGSIGYCTSLIELHLGFNAITTLPDELGACQQLKTLDARNNKMQELSAGVCSLKLNLLDLTNNDLRTLPPQLGLMTSLRSLPLEGNPLKLIRRELVAGPISALLKFLESRLPEPGQTQDPRTGHAQGAGARQGMPSAAPRSGNVWGHDEAQMAADAARRIGVAAAAAEAAEAAGTAVKMPSRWGTAGPGPGSGPAVTKQQEHELSLRRSNLREVPAEVWAAAEWLTKLDLTGNPLGFVPPQGLAACTRLRSLGLSATGLQQWPLPLVHQGMPALAELLLSQNRELWAIPRHAFVTCPGLVVLDLAGVPGAGNLAPGSLLPLTRLQTLDLSQTGCTAFPMDVLSLPTLRNLKLGTNKLTQVPDQLAQACPRLEELDLSNNDLNSVSPYLSLLSGTLRSLQLEGNPLRTMRRAVLDKGTPGILAYLKDRMPA